MRFPNSFPSSSHVLKIFPTAPQFYSIPFLATVQHPCIYKLEWETYHKALAASTQIIFFRNPELFKKKFSKKSCERN